ncbi:MAG: UbiA prenyltransferase family protein [Bacteroidia bacterium]|nr:UbiA prenyltransferase family protein [Bacteroidia bacterium]MDW8134762.1 UbiA prenyltransferase family protein [Bacteroidia bacterium]
MAQLKAWISLFRPHHYTKNILLFAPLVFARHWQAFPHTLAGFMAWSLLASAVYAINDAQDAPRDRLHPTKRFRPVASGIISPQQSLIAAILLSIIGLTCAALLKTSFFFISLLYVLNNILYTFWVKKLPLWDVFSISAGFLLRAYGGAALGEIPISAYFFMCVFFLSLFLALGKRRHELLLASDEAPAGRPALEGYSVYYLDQLMVITATLALAVYMLYLMQGSFSWLMGTLPVAVMGIFRYYHLTHNKGRGEPSQDLFADPLLLILGGIYGLLALLEMLRVPFPSLPR